MMGWEKIPNIQWYGERGIINAVVTYISHENLKDRLERLKKFLKVIKWGKDHSPDWICDISDFKIVVELGLADFGNPDLIIVCKVKDDGRYCIFIEAKVGQYKKSMQSNKEGMDEKGFNSSINGQLSLKYRFATALNKWEWDCNQGLIEPEDIYKKYKDNLKDNHRGNPRKIVKPEIINKILVPLGLMKLDDKRFYFVAWTWDNDDHIFFNDDEVMNDGMPPFYNAAGEIEKRLGWLGYKNLEESLGLDGSEEYMAARKTMIDSNGPDQNDEYYTADRITPKNWIVVNENIKRLSQKISKIFEDPKAKELEGSYSITYGNKVVAKIIPQDRSVFVGFRINIVDAIPDNPKLKVIRSNPSGVLFKGIEVPPNGPVTNVKKFINECLNHIEDTWYMNDV